MILSKEQFEVERIVATTIVEEPEVLTVPGDLDPRVLRGVEWLDKTIPGWADRIDLDLFDISKGRRCVLGQLAASEEAYPEVARRYFGDPWGSRVGGLGFYIDGDENRRERWDVLQESWVRAIEFRQAASARGEA